MERKARDSNPHSPQGSRFSKAVRPGRIRLPSSNWSGPAGESNPDLLVASQASSRWTSRPLSGPGRVARPGLSPTIRSRQDQKFCKFQIFEDCIRELCENEPDTTSRRGMAADETFPCDTTRIPSPSWGESWTVQRSCPASSSPSGSSWPGPSGGIEESAAEARKMPRAGIEPATSTL